MASERMAVLLGATAAMSFLLGGCNLYSSGLYGYDEHERYLNRTDVVTMSAGDAKQKNAVIHMIHPWPRYVFNRQVPVDAERMARAVERYKKGPPQTRTETKGTSTTFNSVTTKE